MSFVSALPADIHREVAYFLTIYEIERFPSKILQNEDDIFWKQKLVQRLQIKIRPITLKSIYEHEYYSNLLINGWDDELIDDLMKDEVFLTKYIHLESGYGHTILTYLCRYSPCEKYTEHIKTLIENYVDVNYKDSTGRTALWYTLDKQIYDPPTTIINILLEAGADINATNQKGETILINAMFFDVSYARVKLLLDMGANVHLKDNKGQTALDVARAKNRPEFIIRLLENAFSK
jgi:hypothetical protein